MSNELFGALSCAVILSAAQRVDRLPLAERGIRRDSVLEEPAT